MSKSRTAWIAAGVMIAAALGAAVAEPEKTAGSSPEAPALTVDADLALHAFQSLADGHLQKLADLLHLVAATEDARSAEWERIRGPLAQVAAMSVPAVFWFAKPDGGYWTVADGRAAGKLSDRAYFPRLLAGQTVLGELVVSRSTSRNTAVVAVPVRASDDAVVGALGASVYLDRLGEIVRGELGGLPPGCVFFAIDSRPMGALHSDPEMIFTDPMKLGDQGMQNAFRQILSSREGTVAYTFRGRQRTMIYRQSPVTGWWYAFGASRE